MIQWWGICDNDVYGAHFELSQRTKKDPGKED